MQLTIASDNALWRDPPAIRKPGVECSLPPFNILTNWNTRNAVWLASALLLIQFQLLRQMRLWVPQRQLFPYAACSSKNRSIWCTAWGKISVKKKKKLKACANERLYCITDTWGKEGCSGPHGCHLKRHDFSYCENRIRTLITGSNLCMCKMDSSTDIVKDWSLQQPGT